MMLLSIVDVVALVIGATIFIIGHDEKDIFIMALGEFIFTMAAAIAVVH